MCVGGHALGGGACHLSSGGYIQQKCGTSSRTTLSSTEQAGIADGLPEKGMYMYVLDTCQQKGVCVYYVRVRYLPEKRYVCVLCT